jgi:hypothetical protein
MAQLAARQLAARRVQRVREAQLPLLGLAAAPCHVLPVKSLQQMRLAHGAPRANTLRLQDQRHVRASRVGTDTSAQRAQRAQEPPRAQCAEWVSGRFLATPYVEAASAPPALMGPLALIMTRNMRLARSVRVGCTQQARVPPLVRETLGIQTPWRQ